MKITENRNKTNEKQPMFNLPRVVIALLVVLWLMQIFLTFFPIELYKQTLILYFGFIPASLTNPEQFRFGSLSLIWAIFTHALLHSGWEHLIINSAWLVIFGTPVAYRYGVKAFIIIFFVSAAAGAILFAFFNWGQLVLLIGASGGIAGLTGVAIRFIFQPIEVSKNPETGEIIVLGRALASFKQLMNNKTSKYFIIIWLGLNSLIPILPLIFNIAELNIAWQAHLGGFFAGLFLAPLFEKR